MNQFMSNLVCEGFSSCSTEIWSWKFWNAKKKIWWRHTSVLYRALSSNWDPSLAPLICIKPLNTYSGRHYTIHPIRKMELSPQALEGAGARVMSKRSYGYFTTIDHFRIVSIRPGWAHSQRRVCVNITIPLHWPSCEWTLTLPIFLVFVRYQQ